MKKTEKTYEPRPQKEPVNWEALREDIYKRFSKSFEKLAKH